MSGLLLQLPACLGLTMFVISPRSRTIDCNVWPACRWQRDGANPLRPRTEVRQSANPTREIWGKKHGGGTLSVRFAVC